MSKYHRLQYRSNIMYVLMSKGTFQLSHLALNVRSCPVFRPCDLESLCLSTDITSLNSLCMLCSCRRKLMSILTLVFQVLLGQTYPKQYIIIFYYYATILPLTHIESVIVSCRDDQDHAQAYWRAGSQEFGWVSCAFQNKLPLFW